jgi:uncharacterized protein YaaN involved in tellurite resistance
MADMSDGTLIGVETLDEIPAMEHYEMPAPAPVPAQAAATIAAAEAAAAATPIEAPAAAGAGVGVGDPVSSTGNLVMPVAPVPVQAEIVVAPKIVQLSAEEASKKDAIVKQIDFADATLSMNYGVGLEKALAPITESILSSTRTRDLGAVGSLITNVMVQVKNIDTEGKDKSFLSRLFNNARNKVEVLKAEFSNVEDNINRLDRELEGYQITLRQDFMLMEKLYEQNRSFARSLTLYVLAGQEALEGYRNGQLAELIAKAQTSGLAEDAQEVKRAESLANSFEKRLDALMAIKTTSIQMAPQIQLMQGNNMSLAESLNNTRSLVLPLWKSQYSLAIVIEHERQIVDVQKKVSDATNELLRKNAEMLRQATVDIAKEGERPIIDIETLRHVNTQIISSLEDILRIQEEGRKLRAESEQAYAQIEGELAAQAMKFARSGSLLSGEQEVSLQG